jgi:hypothetical protein
LGLDGTREHQTPFAEDVNGQRRSSTIKRKDIGKRIFGDRNLVHLKCDIAAEIYDLRHHPLLALQARQRPVLDRPGCRQSVQEIIGMKGERMKPKPDGL